MDAIYTATATATGDGRNGHTASEDGILDVDVRVPMEMGGPGGATNPEQMFAAGYAACFHSAMKFVAAADKVELPGSAVSASVSLGVMPAGGFGLAVELHVEVPSLDHAAALALVERAHQTCPYSNAVRGNVDVKLSVVA